jgi:Domain of unknown function (DUF1972)
MPTRVAVIGSHGLGATYGGWDFLVNSLARYHAADIHLWIFNSGDTPVPDRVPPGVRVTRMFMKANGFQGLAFDFLSIIISAFLCDTLLLLGAQGIPLAALIKRISNVRVVVNLGGMEWERPKFSRPAKWYLRWCAGLSLRHADATIIDNLHFKALLPAVNGSPVVVIPYAGEIDTSLSISPELLDKYPFLRRRYLLCVARALQDNLLEELCASLAHAEHHLVLVSTFARSEYGKRVHGRYHNMPNLTLVDGVWNKQELDLIRRNCTAYIHTHTLCGSAPSLIEMVVAQKPIFSVDAPQNRYTLENSGAYFLDCSDLPVLLASFGNQFQDLIPPVSLAMRYAPETIVDSYEALFRSNMPAK